VNLAPHRPNRGFGAGPATAPLGLLWRCEGSKPHCGAAGAPLKWPPEGLFWPWPAWSRRPRPLFRCIKKCAFSRGVTAAARARAVLVGPSPCRCRASRPPPARARSVVRFHNFPVRARAVAPWLWRPVEAHGGACCCWPKGGAGGRAAARWLRRSAEGGQKEAPLRLWQGPSRFENSGC
jgi:hypothetical protein